MSTSSSADSRPNLGLANSLSNIFKLVSYFFFSLFSLPKRKVAINLYIIFKLAFFFICVHEHYGLVSISNVNGRYGLVLEHLKYPNICMTSALNPLPSTSQFSKHH